MDIGKIMLLQTEMESLAKEMEKLDRDFKYKFLKTIKKPNKKDRIFILEYELEKLQCRVRKLEKGGN